MIQYMTRIILEDGAHDAMATRWLLWLDTPRETEMTHAAWAQVNFTHHLLSGAGFGNIQAWAESRQR